MSWTITTPTKIAIQPSILFVSKIWFNKIHPAIVPKTDSIERIIAAGAGLALLWAIICNV